MASTTALPNASAAPKNPGASVALGRDFKRRWILAVWIPCLIYAIVRYNVFKGVEWIHLPLYIVNKSFAMAGIAFLAGSYLVGKWIRVAEDEPERQRAIAKYCGLTGLTLVGMHMVASLAMLSPAYYAKFFHETGKLNLTGEITFLCGVLGIGALACPAISTIPGMFAAMGRDRWLRMQRMGYVALAAAAGHTCAMGWKGWIDVATWPGGMPPITLIGFLIALTALVAKLFSKPRPA